MPTVDYKGIKFNVDGEGYLENIEDWSETVAQALAEREGVGELTKEKIEILKFMRDYYKQFNAFPMLGYVCKHVHQKKECVTEQFIDPIEAWKVAGLPKPLDEAIEHLKRPAGPHHSAL